MSGAFIPVWIIGGPFIGLLFLSLLYRSGSSAGSRMDLSLHDRYKDWSDRDEHRPTTRHEYEANTGVAHSPDFGAIAELSSHVLPGSISEFSRPVSPGAISRLSGHKNPGAISTLSAPRLVGSIAHLSAGWLASNIVGLPLLTRSQAPLEPDETLLISDRP